MFASPPPRSLPCRQGARRLGGIFAFRQTVLIPEDQPACPAVPHLSTLMEASLHAAARYSMGIFALAIPAAYTSLPGGSEMSLAG